MPNLGRFGAERGRFAFLGFGTTFLGVFVSATGTLLAPFVASHAPNRYNHAATLGALMRSRTSPSSSPSASSASRSAASCR